MGYGETVLGLATLIGVTLILLAVHCVEPSDDEDES